MRGKIIACQLSADLVLVSRPGMTIKISSDFSGGSWLQSKELSRISVAQLPQRRPSFAPVVNEVRRFCSGRFRRHSVREFQRPAAFSSRTLFTPTVSEVQHVEKQPQLETVNFPLEAAPTVSGYLPVSDSIRSQLFYVFYEATDPCSSLVDTPLLLWLNGGPGCSSLIGCFYELGPWRISRDGVLHDNPWAWNRRFGILFLDNPLGTGFSLASSDEDVPRDQQTIASHLHHAIKAFIAENPSFELRPLFLTGESYAGKYVPSLAHYILKLPHSENEHNIGTQLMGIAVGNGLTHPVTQVLHHSDVVYAFALLDPKQKSQCQMMAEEIVALIDREEWLKAHQSRTSLIKWIEETSGIATLLDVRRSAKYHHLEDGTEYLEKFLNAPNVKSILKADAAATWVSCKQSIRNLLAEDTMKSAKWMLEEILKQGCPVLLFQGQYDAKDGPSSSEAWMHLLNWEHVESFWATTREVWRVDGMLAGYRRQHQNLTHVVLTGAGHQVPHDQPRSSQIMIETWINKQRKPSKDWALESTTNSAERGQR